jgi:SAM-dependent methyltransferase
VNVAHKIAKLFRPESYRRGWRRFQRRLHPIPLRPLLDRLDSERIRDIKTLYANSPIQVSKYANVEQWMKTNIERVQDLNLHRSASCDILDLGCGGGYFLYVSEQLGHRCLGFDLDWFPLYTELIELFGVERRLGEIKAYEPLPDLGRRFDWITAFSTGFNRRADKTLWGPNEWEFFLNDLARHLKPGGHLFVGLNPGQNGWYYTPELHDFFVRCGARVERERVYFPSLAASGAPAA